MSRGALQGERPRLVLSVLVERAEGEAIPPVMFVVDGEGVRHSKVWLE